MKVVLGRLRDKAHVIMLGAGLLNVVVLPFWQLPITKATARAVGYPVFGLGLLLLLLSLLALKRGVSGEIEPVTGLVTSGIYARLRHPLYLSFVISMLALDLLFASVLGILVTLLVFLPSMVWRARLEEQVLARRFGEAWREYARRVPSLLLWDVGRRDEHEMSVAEVPEAAFESFLRSQADPLFTTLATYKAWRQEMGILWAFWASGEERLALLGVEEGGQPLAVARVLRVPFYERKQWGGQGEDRGEVQDLALARPDERLLAPLIKAAEELFQAHGLTAFGVSAWVPWQWPLLEQLGLSPYKRSVLLGWDVARPLLKRGNPDVAVRVATPDERPLLRQIQQASWGFFIPPDFARQEVLIAWLGERPVGSAYLNRATGNLDFGVHVVRERWRQRVGTAVLEAAQQRCLAWGLPRMTVVRVLRALTQVNPADRQAWCFYRACGGRLLREVRGFRRKRRPRPLALPELLDCEEETL